jgi:hypothetical protein
MPQQPLERKILDKFNTKIYNQNEEDLLINQIM